MSQSILVQTQRLDHLLVRVAPLSKKKLKEEIIVQKASPDNTTTRH